MDLLRIFLRARALEAALAVERRQGVPAGYEGVDPGRRTAELPLSPALPAAASLRAASDGTGDLFSLRVGSPAAALAMGASPEELLRQAMGRATAPAEGRDPGGFPTDLRRGLLAPVSLPGTLLEVMAGVALALRRRREPRVALVVDDTAGSGSGDWHEGLNFAAVAGGPLVVVNDDTARSPTDSAVEAMAERADAYGFRVHPVQACDPRAILETCRTAVEAARQGDGLQVVDVRPDGSDPMETLLVQAREEGRSEVDGLTEEAAREVAAALERVRSEAPPPVEAVLPARLPVPARSPHRVRTPRPWS
ncbi:MAG: thiamine pyrophosphate-dependent enzyme [Gemmatimonadota bacterium]